MKKSDETTTVGRWTDGHTPHAGWSCYHVEDLGEDYEGGSNSKSKMLCEMCEIAQIRFVHHMKHPSVNYCLRVGCVCAGKMENDAPKAKKRDIDLRNRSVRLNKWLTTTWAQTNKGEDKRSKYDYAFVIHEEKNSWRFSVRSKWDGTYFYTPNKNLTSTAAKRAAFLWLEKELSENRTTEAKPLASPVPPKVITPTIKSPSTSLWATRPSNGADFSKIHPDDVLHQAAVNLQLGRVIELLNMGVPAGKVNVHGFTPLLCIYAKTQNDLTFSEDIKVIIRLLLLCGPSSKTIEALTPEQVRHHINAAKFTHWLNKFVVPTRDPKILSLLTSSKSKLRGTWDNNDVGFRPAVK